MICHVASVSTADRSVPEPNLSLRCCRTDAIIVLIETKVRLNKVCKYDEWLRALEYRGFFRLESKVARLRITAGASAADCGSVCHAAGRPQEKCADHQRDGSFPLPDHHDDSADSRRRARHSGPARRILFRESRRFFLSGAALGGGDQGLARQEIWRLQLGCGCCSGAGRHRLPFEKRPSNVSGRSDCDLWQFHPTGERSSARLALHWDLD